ncbi:MAG: hypothetical protein ACLUGI_11750 [Subdoligranulum sp.]
MNFKKGEVAHDITLALIGSARNGNQDLVLSLSTKAKKNAAKYADEVIVLSKGVQDYFKETYGRETHFIPNGVNA